MTEFLLNEPERALLHGKPCLRHLEVASVQKRQGVTW
jgi:hypothetical protein